MKKQKNKKKHPSAGPSMPKPPLNKTNKSWIHEGVEGFSPLPSRHTLQAIKQLRFRLGVVTGSGAPDSDSNLLQQQWTERGFDWTEVGLKDKGRLNAQPRPPLGSWEREQPTGLCWNRPANRQQMEMACFIDMPGNEQWHAFGYLGICIWHHVFCHNKCIPCGKLSIRMTNLHTNQRPIRSQETWSCLIPINVSEQTEEQKLHVLLDYHIVYIIDSRQLFH